MALFKRLIWRCKKAILIAILGAISSQLLPGIAFAGSVSFTDLWNNTNGVAKPLPAGLKFELETPAAKPTQSGQTLVPLEWTQPTLPETNGDFTAQGVVVSILQCNVNYKFQGWDIFRDGTKVTTVTSFSPTSYTDSVPTPEVSQQYTYQIKTSWKRDTVNNIVPSPTAYGCKEANENSLVSSESNTRSPTITKQGTSNAPDDSHEQRAPKITRIDEKIDESRNGAGDLKFVIDATPSDTADPPTTYSVHAKKATEATYKQLTTAVGDLGKLNPASNNGAGGIDEQGNLNAGFFHLPVPAKGARQEWHVAVAAGFASGVPNPAYSKGSTVTISVDTNGAITVTRKLGSVAAPTSSTAPSDVDTGSCDKDSSKFWENYMCHVVEGFIEAIWKFYLDILDTLFNFTVDSTFLAPLLQFQGDDQIWARNINSLALNLVNYLIVLTLLFLSFVNILHINIDTYGIKKTMPMLVMGVVLANFANLICRLIVDLSDVLTASLIGDPNVFMRNIGSALGFGSDTLLIALTTIGVFGSVIALATPFGLLAAIAGALILLFPFLLMVYLMLLFWVRYYIVIGLVAIAPLAFAALGTPLTQEYFKKWWDMFLRWAFMAPIAYFMLRLATYVVASPGSANQQKGLTGFLVAATCVYLATRIPFQLGGDIMAKWGGLVHKVGGWAGKTADYNIGKLSQKMGSEKPMTFTGLYKGWKRRGEEREHELQGEAEATGMAASEAVNRAGGFMAPAKLLKAALGGKEGLKEYGGEIQKAYQIQDQKAMTLVTSRLAKEAEGLNEAYGEIGGDELRGDISKSLGAQRGTDGKLLKNADGSFKMSGNQDYEAAKARVLVAARRGELDRETWEAFKQAFGKTNGGEVAALDALIPKLQLKADNAHHSFSSTMKRGKDGKFTNKTSQEQEDDDLNQEQKMYSHKGTAAAQTHLTIQYNKIKDKRFEQLNDEEKKVLRFFQSLGRQHVEMRLGAAEAEQLFRPKVELRAGEFSDMVPDTREAVRESIDRAGYGMPLPRRDDEKFRAMTRNLKNPDEWNKVLAMHRKRRTELFKALDNSGVNPAQYQADNPGLTDRQLHEAFETHVSSTVTDHTKRAAAHQAIAQLETMQRAIRELDAVRNEAPQTQGQASMFDTSLV